MSAVRRPVRGTDGVAVGAVVVAGASVPYPSTFPTLVPRLAAEYRAACRQFDVDHGEQAESGPRQACRTCPVLQQGRCHALAVGEPYRDMGLGYRSDQGISTQDLGQQRGPTRKPTRNPLRRSDRTPKKHKIARPRARPHRRERWSSRWNRRSTPASPGFTHPRLTYRNICACRAPGAGEGRDRCQARARRSLRSPQRAPQVAPTPPPSQVIPSSSGPGLRRARKNGTWRCEFRSAATELRTGTPRLSHRPRPSTIAGHGRVIR